MSTAGKVLVVLVMLMTVVWMILAAGVAQLNTNAQQAAPQADRRGREAPGRHRGQPSRGQSPLSRPDVSVQEKVDREIAACSGPADRPRASPLDADRRYALAVQVRARTVSPRSRRPRVLQTDIAPKHRTPSRRRLADLRREVQTLMAERQPARDPAPVAPQRVPGDLPARTRDARQAASDRVSRGSVLTDWQAMTDGSDRCRKRRSGPGVGRDRDRATRDRREPRAGTPWVGIVANRELGDRSRPAPGRASWCTSCAGCGLAGRGRLDPGGTSGAGAASRPRPGDAAAWSRSAVTAPSRPCSTNGPTVPLTVLPAGTENLVAQHFGLRRDPHALAADDRRRTAVPRRRRLGRRPPIPADGRLRLRRRRRHPPPPLRGSSHSGRVRPDQPDRLRRAGPLRRASPTASRPSRSGSSTPAPRRSCAARRSSSSTCPGTRWGFRSSRSPATTTAGSTW